MRSALRASDFRPHARVVNAVFVSVLAVAGALLTSTPAQAATKTYLVDRQSEAWYWSSNRDVRLCNTETGLCSPRSGQAVESPITPGHLAVSLKNGESDMRSYLAFEFDVPFGSQAQSLSLRLQASRLSDDDADHRARHAQSGGKPPATLNEDAAKMKACLLKGAFGPAFGAPPAAIADSHDPTVTQASEPEALGQVDTSNCVPGVRDFKSGEWVFDLSRMARLWLAGDAENNGVAILPEPGGPTTTWLVEFHGGQYTGVANNVEYEYVATSEAPRGILVYEPPPPEVLPTPDPTPYVPPVDEGPVFVPPPPEVIPTVAPVASPTPTIEPSTEPVAQANPVTPWYAWIMLPIGLVGFVVLSRSLGREVEETDGNRVASTLRRRRNYPGE